jgi:primosomal protein N' (replication factor Y) (superfamily II helicase)
LKAFADIVPLGTRIDQAMTYRVPDDLLQSDTEGEAIERGSRVLVPLGPRWATGVVVDFHDHTEIDNVRAIGMRLDPYAALPEGLLKTCEWIAGYYLCSLSEVLGAALPAGIHTQSGQRIALGTPPADRSALDKRQRAILECVEEAGPLSVKQLERRVGPKIRSTIHGMCRSGILTSVQEMSKPRTAVKKERYVQLVPEDPRWMEVELPAIEKRAPKQAQCLTLLHHAGGTLPSRDLSAQGIDSAIVRRLVDRKILKVTQREIRRDPYASETPEQPEDVIPTAQQAAALEEILADTEVPRYRTHLVNGVTGSGKTLIYIKAVERALEQGRGAIVLIPEISLTPQTVGRFRAHFGDRVAVLHSGLNEGERYDAWRDLREGRKQIVVGARSAVFAPIPNLGVIVVDEEHDGSYKQDNPAPRYNARDVAVVRAQTEGVPVILGSATPSLESYRNASAEKFNLIKLDQRVDARPMPTVTVVDMRHESGLFSTSLHEKILERLERKELIILLQNRRGYAPYIQCGGCGDALQCASCHVSLTLHGSGARGRLICHYCGHSQQMPRACPSCQEEKLKLLGLGTQKVEEVLSRQYPDARVLRMDVDATSKKGSHAKILNAFGRGEADILLGTQMVAKGLDFPGVTLVGVISADTGLNLPDFRAGERTFQLLTQVSGRAGRGERPGEVVVQTYKPEEDAIRFAREHDFEAFAESEDPLREQTGFPPFSRLALFLFKGMSESDVAQRAGHCADILRTTGITGVDVLGPVQAPLSRLQGRYRWHVILRSPSHQALNRTIRYGLEQFGGRGTRGAVTIDVDVDPISML